MPSDLRDVDRVEYRSYSELEIALQRLLAQELPPPRPLGQKNFIDTLRENIMELLRKNPGLKIGDIPKAVEQTIDLTQVAIRPMIDVELRTTGAKRGTRYYVIE